MKIIPTCFIFFIFLFISSPALCFDLEGYWFSEHKALEGVKIIEFNKKQFIKYGVNTYKKQIRTYKSEYKIKDMSANQIEIDFLFMGSPDSGKILINNENSITVYYPSEDVISYVRTTKENAMDFLNNQIH